MADDDGNDDMSSSSSSSSNARYDSNGMEICRVYAGDDLFTIVVQILLCGMALASLWYKRLNETPRRKFITWFLDVSKQAIGAGYAHVLNMMIANIIATNVRGEYQLEDECAWYAINYLFDTSLGLLFSILFLQLLDKVANQHDWKTLKDSGVYHGPDRWMHWFHQISAWLFILTIVKVLVLFVMWLLSGFLAKFGAILFAPLQGNIRFELVFVMIFFPGCLNIIWFWITDTYLKAKPTSVHAHEDETDVDSKGEALISSSNNDDNNGNKDVVEAQRSSFESLEGGQQQQGQVQQANTSYTSPTLV